MKTVKKHRKSGFRSGLRVWRKLTTRGRVGSQNQTGIRSRKTVGILAANLLAILPAPLKTLGSEFGVAEIHQVQASPETAGVGTYSIL